MLSRREAIADARHVVAVIHSAIGYRGLVAVVVVGEWVGESVGCYFLYSELEIHTSLEDDRVCYARRVSRAPFLAPAPGPYVWIPD